MERRKLIGIASAVGAATLGTILILNQSSSTSTAALTATTIAQKVDVLKVVRAIPAGTPASELSSYVKTVKVTPSEKSDKAVSSITQLSTLVASVQIAADQQIDSTQFVTPESLRTKADVASGLSDKGLIGVWVQLEPVNALNGALTPGVTDVAVFGSMPAGALDALDPTKQALAETKLLLHHVPVLDVMPKPEIVTPIINADGSTGPILQPQSATTPISVKLGVSAAAAEQLVYAATNGKLYLGEEPKNSDTYASSAIRNRGNVFEQAAEPAPVGVPASTPSSIPAPNSNVGSVTGGTPQQPVRNSQPGSPAATTATTVMTVTTIKTGAPVPARSTKTKGSPSTAEEI